MRNNFKKGTLIMIVDENGKDTQWQMWLDKDRNLEKGDIFELATTKNAPLIKMKVMSSQIFPLIVSEI